MCTLKSSKRHGSGSLDIAHDIYFWKVRGTQNNCVVKRHFSWGGMWYYEHNIEFSWLFKWLAGPQKDAAGSLQIYH